MPTPRHLREVHTALEKLVELGASREVFTLTGDEYDDDLPIVPKRPDRFLQLAEHIGVDKIIPSVLSSDPRNLGCWPIHNHKLLPLCTLGCWVCTRGVKQLFEAPLRYRLRGFENLHPKTRTQFLQSSLKLLLGYIISRGYGSKRSIESQLDALLDVLRVRDSLLDEFYGFVYFQAQNIHKFNH